MNTRLVLDTSAVLAYFNGSRVAMEAMNRAKVVYLPSVSIGELYFGARKCSRPTQEEVKIEGNNRSNRIARCRLRYGQSL